MQKEDGRVTAHGWSLPSKYKVGTEDHVCKADGRHVTTVLEARQMFPSGCVDSVLPVLIFGL